MQLLVHDLENKLLQQGLLCGFVSEFDFHIFAITRLVVGGIEGIIPLWKILVSKFESVRLFETEKTDYCDSDSDITVSGQQMCLISEVHQYFSLQSREPTHGFLKG